MDALTQLGAEKPYTQDLLDRPRCNKSYETQMWKVMQKSVLAQQLVQHEPVLVSFPLLVISSYGNNEAVLMLQFGSLHAVPHSSSKQREAGAMHVEAESIFRKQSGEQQHKQDNPLEKTLLVRTCHNERKFEVYHTSS